MILLSLLAFLLIFSILILVHEWGHFTAARMSGVKVEEFALGLGKKVIGKKVGETQYNINAIPFGGFVRMLGEEEDSSDPRAFNKAKLWKRMVITLAGVCMNFLLAIFALTVLFTIGTNPIIITKDELKNAVAQGTVVMSEPDEKGMQSILEIHPVQKPFPQSFLFAVTETGRIAKAVLQKAGEIPIEIIEKHRLPEGLSGPVGIAEATHRILPQGVMALIKLLALLSISLGVMNLLPIPALDGGRFLFQLIELIFRRKPPAKWENAIHMGGYIFLLTLMVIITWNDIARLVGGGV